MQIETPFFELPLQRLKNLFATSTIILQKDIQNIIDQINLIKSMKTEPKFSDVKSSVQDCIKKLKILKSKVL